jgi:hypothetical protein
MVYTVTIWLQLVTIGYNFPIRGGVSSVLYIYIPTLYSIL